MNIGTGLLIFISASIFALVWFVWKKTSWKRQYKWIATICIAVVFLFVLASANENNKPIAKEAAAPQTQAPQPQQLPEAQNQNDVRSEIKTHNESQETFRVARVIDGDTIKLANGQVVRYIGIDAPETVDPEKPVQCFGKEASDKDRELVEGKEVTLVKDVSETDKYGRILRYVYVGDTFVNDYLVRDGFARADNFPPDEKFKDQFKSAQLEAKNAKRGLWANAACQTK